MACPFFYPLERFEDGEWLTPPRLPLGDPCRGECRAEPEFFQPSAAAMRDFCNLGYARGHCARFPPDAEPDAVRFSVARHHANSIELVYILEKDHGPLRFGPLRYDTAAAAWVETPGDPILGAQAQGFLDSYLKRRAKP